MSKLLYNGIELPALPDWDKTTYPVAVISNVFGAGLPIYGQSPYILSLGKGTLWQSGKCYVRGIYAVYRLSNDEWVWHYGSGTVSTQDIVAANYFEAVWTNTNIPTVDGTGIYLAASAPVDPNAPEEPVPEEPAVQAPAVFRRGFMAGFIVGMNVRGLLRKKTITESYPSNCVTFAAAEPFTLATYNGVKNWNGTLEYSTDAVSWSEWDAKRINSANNRIYVRGKGNSIISGDNFGAWVLKGDNIRCVGNIENLLDYETVANGDHPIMGKRCYYCMFSDCTALTTAPELPATTLADECYMYMFSDCTSLTTPPSKLSAETMKFKCYRGMFQNCTSLITAPELPAHTLATGCYAFMFRGCTSLTTAPILPATTLADDCYMAMFSGCTSLKIPLELPATTLKDGCYADMFRECTNIKLSTTQTDDYQIPYTIPPTGDGTDKSSGVFPALVNMFTNTGGTFTGTPSINTKYYTSNEVV